MDKIEITDEAEKIGTYETSIEPDQDCCTLFVPRHPNTRCSPEQVQKAEERFNVTELVEQGLAGMELSEFTFSES